MRAIARVLDPRLRGDDAGGIIVAMALNPDELEPPRPTLKPLDLQQMSVEELKEYIAALEAEISRAEGMIAKKEAHKSGIEGLFKKS